MLDVFRRTIYAWLFSRWRASEDDDGVDVWSRYNPARDEWETKPMTAEEVEVQEWNAKQW